MYQLLHRCFLFRNRLAQQSDAPEGTYSKYTRNLQSYHKQFLFTQYGGVLWATLLACLGFIDQHVVNACNEVISSRVRTAGREPQEGGIPDPRLSRRALAATQGQEMPSKRGVYHVPSEPKKAREAAKSAVHIWEQHVARWWQAFHSGKTRNGDWWEAESDRFSCLGREGCEHACSLFCNVHVYLTLL